MTVNQLIDEISKLSLEDRRVIVTYFVDVLDEDYEEFESQEERDAYWAA